MFRYLPDEGYSGPDEFSFYATDSDDVRSPAYVMRLQVYGNEPPVCRDLDVTVVAGSKTAIGFDCSDEPVDRDHLRFGVSSPAFGLLQHPPLAGYAFITFPRNTPAQMDSFTYWAADGKLVSAPATVRMKIVLRPVSSERYTFLLSRNASGGFPNAPSRNGTASHDQRIARVMAFESDASDLVGGDVNGHSDIFLVRRQRPWGADGTPWWPDQTELASVAGRGPANGPSYRPALDGDSHHPPRCLAFLSKASNLVPGDSNRVADAFVRELATGRVSRVSLDRSDRQLRVPTSEVTVDGDCGRVAFVAGRPSGRRVLVRYLSHAGVPSAGGRTAVVSAPAQGRGNGPSFDVALARDGKSLAFASAATNLDRRDRGQTTDIYRRSLARRGKRLRHAPLLVSRTARGEPGNGPSHRPTITDQGRYIAYETEASDLVASDGNRATDVVRTNLRGRTEWVSREGNANSGRPSISGAGNFVFFESDASNFKQKTRSRDPNGKRDVFLWNAPTRNISRESRLPDNGDIGDDSGAPATSSRGNYLLFESLSPFVDTAMLERTAPGWGHDKGLLAALDKLRATGGTRQVYLRYLGPK
jgi:hypothetical protein